MLVHMKSGFVEWTPIGVENGRQLAQVKVFQRGGTVNGVDLRSLRGMEVLVLSPLGEGSCFYTSGMELAAMPGVDGKADGRSLSASFKSDCHRLSQIGVKT